TDRGDWLAASARRGQNTAQISVTGLAGGSVGDLGWGPPPAPADWGTAPANPPGGTPPRAGGSHEPDPNYPAPSQHPAHPVPQPAGVSHPRAGRPGHPRPLPPGWNSP